MGLDTELLEHPAISGHGSGRMCCDPAFGFADQSIHRIEKTTNTHVHVSVGAASQHDDHAKDNVIEVPADVAGMAAGDRNKFLDGYLKVQDVERLRLGRELHDSTGQLLLALRLNVAQLRRVHRTPIEAGLIDEIEDTASQIDREIRSFAFVHYPAEIGRCGLCDALESLARGFATRTGLKISFVRLCDYVKGGPPADALLRVAQEALLNVHRHAHAIHVRVSLTLRERLLELVVRDDGIGIPPTDAIAKSHGVGLQGMRHRVEQLGGRFAIKRLKHGTKLVASVPVG